MQLEKNDLRAADAGAGDSTGSASVPWQSRHKPVIRWREFSQWSVALLRRAPDLREIWFRGRLDPSFREQVMLAVAGANSCRQCSYAHREWALAEGIPEADLAALEGLDAESFDPQKWAAFAWAHAAASSDFTSVPDVIDDNFRRRFSAQEQSDIELIARTMSWANRVTNTVDAGLLRTKGESVPGSGPVRECIALMLYVVISPVAIVVLSIKQRRSPLSTARQIGRLFAGDAAGEETPVRSA